MGRYDFRALRVKEAANLARQVRGRQAGPPPPWLQTMTDTPPSQTVVRTLPTQHRQVDSARRLKKASRMFQPQRITYEEDGLRQEFFQDHPWELARPRIVAEEDGKDSQRWDWGLARQSGRPLNGESVVQRQRWLMSNPTGKDADGRPVFMGKEAAYDQARKEFYRQRQYQEIERRVAQEEAMATGAYFGMSALEVGMHLENQTFDKWRSWAQQQVTLAEQARSAAYTGLANQSNTEDATTTGSGGSAEEPVNALDTAIEELGSSAKATPANAR